MQRWSTVGVYLNWERDGEPILPDDKNGALEQWAQSYRQYSMDALRGAANLDPEMQAHYPVLAQHWRKLAEAFEEEIKRMR